MPSARESAAECIWTGRTRRPTWMCGLHSKDRSRVQSPNRYNFDAVRPATVLVLRVRNRFVGRYIRSHCGHAGRACGFDVYYGAARERGGLKDHGRHGGRLLFRDFSVCRGRRARLSQAKRSGAQDYCTRLREPHARSWRLLARCFLRDTKRRLPDRRVQRPFCEQE